MPRRLRRRQPPPDLTSLFDVLFIVIFAALIRAAAVQKAAAAQPPPPPKPAPVHLDTSALHAKAVATVGERPTIVVRIANASIVAIESAGHTETLDAPLLERDPDPDVAVSYLGDRSAELRICRVVAVHLGAADLASYLVVIAPEQHLADLPHALYDGIHRDVDRCITEQKGLAVIVDPVSSSMVKP